MRSSENHKPRVVLASRKNAGIRVTLLWTADTNTIAVLVRDDSTKDQFELLVEPDSNPIDVYQHPYAHAAWRGIDYRTTNLQKAAGHMQATDQALNPVHNTDNRGSDAAPTSHALFIIPTRRGDGFNASIHGHMLELADPTDHRLAPSPDDLLIASIASDLAWSARRFLRAFGLPDASLG